MQLTPNTKTVIKLSELNEAIAQQKGVTIADLALQGAKKTEAAAKEEPVALTEAVATDDGVLTDEALAAQYRSQADAMFKEAKRLREQAEELAPTKKKTATKKTQESA
jgi:hypothetical protein